MAAGAIVELGDDGGDGPQPARARDAVARLADRKALPSGGRRRSFPKQSNAERRKKAQEQRRRWADDLGGDRPAVVTLQHVDGLDAAENIVCTFLALDSFDGETSAPTYDLLAARTCLAGSTVQEVLARLQEGVPGRRPAMLSNAGRVRGQPGRNGRIQWRLLWSVPCPHKVPGGIDCQICKLK